MSKFTKLLSVLALAFAFSAPAAHAQWGLGVADTTTVTTAQSLSAIFNNGTDWVQTFASIDNTKGGFTFGVGGIYKFTVVGTAATGLHIGPGVTFGTVTDDFAFTVFAAVGAHFRIFDRALVSVDGGPILIHRDNFTNFRLTTLGNHLGLSVHYLF